MSVAVTAGGESDVRFGHRLREWRRRRGLSQSELGGGRFSGSYVSHVESGRRRATPEMIDFFARQLDLEPEALDAPADGGLGAADVSELKVTSLLLQAARAHADHDFARAGRIAVQAVAAASEAGLVTRWWQANQQYAESLFEDGDYRRALKTSVELSNHPSAGDESVMRLEALILATRSARAVGLLEEAAQYARAGVEVAGSGRWPDYQAQTLMALVGVLMELGAQDEAEQVAQTLLDLRDQISSPQLRGTAYWITGNLHLLGGRVEEGVHDHDAAGQLLRPEVDLRAWGRFLKAAALTRLRAGVVDQVSTLLERARQAILLVGNDSDRTELRLLEARLALAEERLTEAEELVRFCLDDESLLAAPHSRAEALELLSDIEFALGRRDEAARTLVSAAALFEEAGALRRSIAAWRAHAEIVDGAEKKAVNFLDKPPST